MDAWVTAVSIIGHIVRQATAKNALIAAEHTRLDVFEQPLLAVIYG